MLRRIVMIVGAAELSAMAAPVVFDGPIESVVVYTSGFAQVSRSGEVQLGAGETVLESRPLPLAADISSILVSLQGKQAEVQAVEMRRVLVDNKELESKIAAFLEEYRKQDDIVFGLLRELASIDEKAKGRRETLALLEKMREKTVQTVDKEMTLQKPDAEECARMIALLQARADSARADIRACVAQRREVERRYAAEQKKLYDLQRKAPKGCDLPETNVNRFTEAGWAEKQQAYQTVRFSGTSQSWQTVVFITVTTKTAVKARMTLKYNVSGANWTPTYRVNADIAGKTAQLDVLGEVRQSSGEDWTGVTLSLSTARPDLGTDVPVLMPWYIRAEGITAPRGELMKRDMKETEAPTEPEPVAEEAAPVSEMATVFTARAKTTIPSDNETHRIPVTTLSSPMDVEHIAIPKILQHAFVQAKLAIRAAFALIPGVLEVMVDGKYLGRGMMNATAPGEEIKLSLGIDEQVKIQLKMVDDKGERKSRGGKVQTTNMFEISAVNYKESDIKLKVIDQLPISADRRIVVTYGPEAKRALRGAEYPGQLKWDLALAPKKPQTIRFDFTIEYPEELRSQLQADEVQYNFNQFEADDKEMESSAPSQSVAPNWKNSAKQGKVKQRVKF